MVSWSSWTVSTTTPTEGWSWRICLVALIPSRLGMSTSISTTSGSSSPPPWMASLPSLASPTTSTPSALRHNSTTPWRVTEWSSTTRTLVTAPLRSPDSVVTAAPLVRLCRDLDPEGGAVLVDTATDRSSHHFGVCPGQGEPEPGAGATSLDRLVGALERLEELFELVAREPGAAVVHLPLGDLVVAGDGHRHHAEPRAPDQAVLDHGAE